MTPRNVLTVAVIVIVALLILAALVGFEAVANTLGRLD